jgi:hypothetical protein
MSEDEAGACWRRKPMTREAKRLAMIRRADSDRDSSHTIGGRPKPPSSRRPITLPKLKCLKEDE